MGKASTGESSPQRRSACRGGGGVFPPGPGSPQRRSPQGRHLLRGGVSPREGSFQGRVSAEEEFPEGRVSLADAGGGRRGVLMPGSSHKTARANAVQPASRRPPEVPGDWERELGSPTAFLPGLALLAWPGPLEALASIPPQPPSTLVIPLPPLPFNGTADKLNTAGITAICSGYRCRY